MAKFANGFYQLINPGKYVGKKVPHYRSSWEHSFMRFCDENPSILQWANESIHIPYQNPFTGKNTIYVPDFFITYVNKNGEQKAELIEIKPLKETTLESARSTRDKAYALLNQCKWAAASAWCKQNGVHFRVVTEMDIFHQGKKRQ